MTKRMMLILAGFGLLLFLSGCVGVAPLSRAAVDNDTEKIKKLVAEGTNVNELDKTAYIYFTALWCAVDSCNHEAVKTLLELGADPNINCSYYGYSQSINSYGYTSLGSYRFNGSPLMAAVLEEDTTIVEMLLKAGADPRAIAEEAPVESSPGMDPLGYGAMNGNLDVAKLLLSYGADANLKYPNNFKAVYEAMARGYLDYAVLLIKSGLVIESDPEYMHYNAELAHLAADFYAQTEEEKSLQFYKQAIELYPGSAKNYESIAHGKWLKEIGKEMFAAAATSFYQYAEIQRIATSQPILGSPEAGNFSYGSSYLFNNQIDYNPKWTETEYFRAKAKQNVKNQTLCQEIVSCYEENKPDVTLADCVKETYQEEGKNLSSQ